MSQDTETSRQIEELRRVLLRPEALIDRISPLLAKILAEQISSSRDEIARALAPVLGEAIRRQVYQAREDIIDALYPVIGQMISRAVTESVRSLAQQIDSRLRRGAQVFLSLRYWQARLRGISTQEFELRNALPFTIHEIFLIQRDSGILICHSSADERLADRDLVSGMLTAIRDFARDAFGRSESGELGEVAYESRQILLEAGGAAYLAVVVEGVPPTNFRERMRQALVHIHDKRYDELRTFDGGNTALVEASGRILGKELLPPPASAVGRGGGVLQRVIMGLIVLLALAPILLCGGWAWRVESSLGVLLAATSTPTSTATATSTPTSTSTPTATPTATSTPTATPTSTSTPTATPTATSTPTVTPTPSPFIGVMIGNVYLYSQPDETSTRSSLVAPLGSPIEVLAQAGDWYRVRVALRSGQTVELIGWVPVQWVSLLKPVAPELITPVAAP